MHTIGIVAFAEYVLNEVTELEVALTRANYPVHIEQMRGKPQYSQLSDFYYEENAILLWLCRCHEDKELCLEAIECFIETKVDLIVAMTPVALEQVIQSRPNAEIPIIFTHVEKPLVQQIISTHSGRAGAITGVYDVWMDLVDDRVALLTELVPPPRMVHTFFNPESSLAVDELRRLERACSTLGMEVSAHVTRTRDEVKEVLTSLKPRHNHAIFRLSDSMLHPVAGLIGAIAQEHYIPYMGKRHDELERCGSLFALEPGSVGREAAALVDSLLRGVNPETITPVEPRSRNLSVNLQAARNLGLIVSPAVLKIAQEVIPARERKDLSSRLRAILFPAILIISVIAVAASSLGVLPLFGLTFLGTTALALALRLYLIRSVIRPLNILTLAAEKIAAGELNTPIPEVTMEDEVSALVRALRRMKSNLSNSNLELENLTNDLEIRVAELTEANRALRQAQHELEIAGRRIIDAEDSSRFALTTYIHDEILGPLDDLSALSQELNDTHFQQLASDLESRMRRLRYDLSVPILQDLGIELRRLIQETLPQIYPNAQQVHMELDLAVLDRLPPIEPASIFLLYRFIRGAVSNVYRHSEADMLKIAADYAGDELSLSVVDNGQGFDLTNLDQFIKSGHYFFHDIQIRARQLRGEFTVVTQLDSGTYIKVSVPVNLPGPNASGQLNRYQLNISP